MKVKDIRMLLAALDDELDAKFNDIYTDGIIVTEDDDFYYCEMEGQMQTWFGSDITWCADSDKCTNTECFRHLTNKNDNERIFTCGALMGTEYCELTKENKD